MDLDNMKAVWFEMDEKLERKQKVTDEIIWKMAHERSSSRLRTIIFMESAGVIVCLMIIIYLLIHFQKLENWLNISGGIGTIIILLLSSILGIRIIRQAGKIDLVQNSYLETLKHFETFKRTLRFYKKLSIIVNIIFPFFLIPVVFTLFLEKDLLTDLPRFASVLLICFALVPVILYFVIRFYAKNIRQVKEALDDLKD